ncbi:MAG: twin-arginine translocation signal domain-containing protein [Planctomycetota bacterium]
MNRRKFLKEIGLGAAVMTLPPRLGICRTESKGEVRGS